MENITPATSLISSDDCHRRKHPHEADHGVSAANNAVTGSSRLGSSSWECAASFSSACGLFFLCPKKSPASIALEAALTERGNRDVDHGFGAIGCGRGRRGGRSHVEMEWLRHSIQGRGRGKCSGLFGKAVLVIVYTSCVLSEAEARLLKLRPLWCLFTIIRMCVRGTALCIWPLWYRRGTSFRCLHQHRKLDYLQQ